MSTWVMGLTGTMPDLTSKPKLVRGEMSKRDWAEYRKEWKKKHAARCRKHTKTYYRKNRETILAKQRAARRAAKESQDEH